MYDDEEEGTVVIDRGAVQPALAAHPFLVFLSGDSPGRMVRIDGELTCGRSERATVRLTGEGVSRLHSRFFQHEGATHVEDMGSTNGTLVNGHRIEGPTALADGDKIQIGASFLLKFSLQDEIDQQVQRDLYDAALRDPLTGVLNRRALFDRLATDVAHATRHGVPLSLLLFDLDRFKRVNDDFGHPAGDHVLRELGRLVGSMIRAEDLFARYGGEEFALACRSTDLAAAWQLAERIRAAVARHAFVHDGQALPVTTSIGAAQLRDGETLEDLVRAADQALFEAKRTGRNRVCART